MTRTPRLPLLLCLVLGLAACGKSPPGEPAAAGGDATADAPQVDAAAVDEVVPPLPELGEFRIASLLLGTRMDADGIVDADREAFAPGDAIHASVLSVGAHPGLRLQATWVAPDGHTIARTDQPIAPEGASATSFHLANTQPWPAGEYELRLAINGHPIQGRKFEVK